MPCDQPLLDSQEFSLDHSVAKHPVLIDRFGRPITNVRISLNSSARCNFRCIHCHMEGIREPPETLMTADEIQRVVRIMSRFGVNAVKLTGGEPMLRRDILEIIEKLGALGMREISMTTNGTRFAKLSGDLRERGLKRVNISLHSLRRDRFTFITGVDKLDEAVSAVRAAVHVGLTPVKVNMTLMRGVNEDEIGNMMDFVLSLGADAKVILQLIELVVTDPRFYLTYHYDLAKLEEELRSQAMVIYRRGMHNRPRYILPNGVTVEVVRPMHNAEFCMGNNRIRVTHDGKFKPCLLREDNHVDFLQAMRTGATDEEITQIFIKAASLREPFFKPKIGEPVAQPLIVPQRTSLGTCEI